MICPALCSFEANSNSNTHKRPSRACNLLNTHTTFYFDNANLLNFKRTAHLMHALNEIDNSIFVQFGRTKIIASASCCCCIKGKKKRKRQQHTQRGKNGSWKNVWTNKMLALIPIFRRWLLKLAHLNRGIETCSFVRLGFKLFLLLAIDWMEQNKN